MATVAFTMLLVLLYFYSSMQTDESPYYVESDMMGDAGRSFSYDARQIFNLNFSNNQTQYSIQEYYWKNKSTILLSKLGSYSGLIQNFANLSLFNESLDYADFNTTKSFSLSGNNTKYAWNYSSEQLKLTGSWSKVNMHFITTQTPSNISGNCGGGSFQLIVRANTLSYSANPSASCTVNVNYSGTLLPITYDGANFSISYSPISFNITNNFTIDVSNASRMRFLGTRYTGDTSSTVNPGWAEPTYPAGAGGTKHYGTVNAAGTSYNLIVLDSDNSTGYDSLYIDANGNGNFTDAIDLYLLQDSAQIYLNNRVFSISITSNGNAVTFDAMLGISVQKGGNSLASGI